MPIVVERGVEDILGWPTDTFSIICGPQEHVHTILVFIPGNPGLCEWYIPLFSKILEPIGPGYTVRGASYVGHSIHPEQINVEIEQNNSDTNIPPKTLAWTLDGQVHHKITYMDKISKEFPQARFILVGHSIGCWMVKRILLYRTDILRRTSQCILLMPFIRMDAPAPQQQALDLVSRNTEASMWILHTFSKILSILPSGAIETLLKSSMDRPGDRIFTAKLLKQSQFARNFLGLGSEEIRDIPEAIDVSAFRYIISRNGVNIAILFAGNDHWAPFFHKHDLHNLICRGVLPAVDLQHNPDLKHDFITSEDQTMFVVDYCVKLIQGSERPRSKL